MYAWAGLPDDPSFVIGAALLSVPAGAVVIGRTAGWLHGLDVDPLPVALSAPPGGPATVRRDLEPRQARIAESDVEFVNAMPVTTMPATLCEIARTSGHHEATAWVDEALHKGLVDLEALRAWAAGHAGTYGIEAFRRTLRVADGGAESPMETRLRLVLLEGALPAPETQARLTDTAGEFVARVDLYYPEARLAIEYDGSTHRDSIAEDNRRHNRLLGAAYRALRFTAADVIVTPGRTVSQVAQALGLRTFPRKRIRKAA